jgi:hypothetical protein
MIQTRKVALKLDKRRARRYPVTMAFSLDCGERKGRVGIALDVSTSGARFNTPSQFEAGDTIEIKLVQEAHEALAHAQGRVVRVERADARSDLPWRFVTSVVFERPLDEIEPTLRRSVSLSSL